MSEILQRKGATVYAISPNATLRDAICEMVDRKIGSLVVSRGRHVWGIITERDILRALAIHRESLDELQVAETMSTELVTARPQDTIEFAMRLMTHCRVRHLPIIADGELCGIVSIGDILKAHHDQLELENHLMRSYIQGEGAEREIRPSNPPLLPAQLAARYVHRG